jgi:glycosyltransferase involved in cell wall biosynthesis
MRVCLIYDCLFPYTVGGAERTYRSLAQLLAAEGHEVTYVTLRQWDRGTTPELPGARVQVAGPRMALYNESGRRRTLPPLVFGGGVLWHLLRHGRRYDAVHCASFPYFSLLATALARPLGRYRVVVDWHEVWTRGYWREYLGAVGGWIGWMVQRLCVRVPQRAFCFSRLQAERLRDEGFSDQITVLPGEWAGPLEPSPVREADPVVVFAGRHIPEKRVPSIPPAIGRARARLPQLRGVILGDGPDRARVLQLVEVLGLADAVDVPGFVSTERVGEELGRALCMVLPSRREGYGLVVLEAAERGTPSVVVDAPDNAAVELISEGENGFVARSAAPEDLAEAILRVSAAGSALRASTAAWFARNAGRFSLKRSLAIQTEAYERGLDRAER